MREHILEAPNKLSLLTLTLAYDISVYYGEVFIYNNPQIRWGYLTKPKKMHGVNAPMLLGFAADMPVYVYRQVEINAWDSVNELDDMRLYDTYANVREMLL